MHQSIGIERKRERGGKEEETEKERKEEREKRENRINSN